MRSLLLFAATILIVPALLAAPAQAAGRHRHAPAHLRTATYKVVPHKATKQHARRMAQAHRHGLMRGS